ncbi:MAG: class I SAM-dependent methyltransferase [Acidobacteriota bacterium]
MTSSPLSPAAKDLPASRWQAWRRFFAFAASLALCLGCQSSDAASTVGAEPATPVAEVANDARPEPFDAETATEAEAIVAVLEPEPEMRVADVGAGDGEWSEVLAEAVGEAGEVFVTEVDEDDLEELRALAEDAPLGNLRVVTGNATDTGLPADCCDAILLRLVYHHFTDPEPMRASLRSALRPGALLAVIDMVPRTDWHVLEGVPERGGHGISMDDLISEMTGDGFEVVQRYADWPEDPDHYCVVFRAIER